MNNYLNKILTKAFLLLLIVSMFSCKSDENSGDNNQNDSSTTQNTEVAKLADYDEPKAFDYISGKDDKLFDEFYPIGHSKEGLFAYIVEPADEATGLYLYSFVIQDLKTNKIVWSKKIDYDDRVETGSIKETWNKNYDKFKEKLNESKIIQAKKYKLERFPSADNKNTNLLFDLKYEEDSFGFGFDVVAKVTAKLTDNSGMSKQIYVEEYTESMILNVNSPGYIKMPETDYIVCIIKTQQRGYEGPPHPVSIKLIGTSLK